MSVVHALATATVSPTPSTSPVAQVVQTVVVTHAATPNAFTDLLNNLASSISQTDIIAIAGVLSSALLALVARSKFLQHEVAVVQDVRRFAVAVILPFLGTYVATLATGHNDLNVAPAIFVVSQVCFYIVKFLKNSGSPVLADAPLATDAPAVG